MIEKERSELKMAIRKWWFWWLKYARKVLLLVKKNNYSLKQWETNERTEAIEKEGKIGSKSASIKRSNFEGSDNASIYEQNRRCRIIHRNILGL